MLAKEEIRPSTYSNILFEKCQVLLTLRCERHDAAIESDGMSSESPNI